MGWFEDNHPMGAISDIWDDKWYKDPQPAGGAPEPKKIRFPESDWDSANWRKSNLGEYETLAKGKIKTYYLLNDQDLLPLSYQKQVDVNDSAYGYSKMKMYKKREVEQVAWAKYGGPNGLKAARTAKRNGVKFPSAVRSSVATSSRNYKAKSSTSAAVGGKQTLLGFQKGNGSSGTGQLSLIK